jgi:hypothetical protein
MSFKHKTKHGAVALGLVIFFFTASAGATNWKFETAKSSLVAGAHDSTPVAVPTWNWT